MRTGGGGGGVTNNTTHAPQISVSIRAGHLTEKQLARRVIPLLERAARRGGSKVQLRD